MRKQLVATVSEVVRHDKRTSLLLGDIGVWGFRELLTEFPERVFNIGILEQSMIGIASGMALAGMVPIVHSIAPFLVERAYEQLKIDFGYQALGGNFISVGASYDYSTLGCTHHGPADVALLHQIPNMQIVVPGTPAEFDNLFRLYYDNEHPTYYRLSKYVNKRTYAPSGPGLYPVIGELVHKAKVVVLAIGPALDWVGSRLPKDLPVALFYTATVRPFDFEALQAVCGNRHLLIVEPYYSSTFVVEASQQLPSTHVESVGLPRVFFTEYAPSFYGSSIADTMQTQFLQAVERLCR